MRITISPISNTVNIINMFKSTFFAPDCTVLAVAAPFKLTALTIPVPVGNRGVGNLRLIGLVGLGPASRVFIFHLLDSLLTATTNISICPHMTSYSNSSIGETDAHSGNGSIRFKIKNGRISRP
jgi:hypothetical protein